jgi:hypothetical protein
MGTISCSAGAVHCLPSLCVLFHHSSSYDLRFWSYVSPAGYDPAVVFRILISYAGLAMNTTKHILIPARQIQVDVEIQRLKPVQHVPLLLWERALLYLEC